MDGPEPIVGFTLRNAQRVARATQHFERQPRNTVPGVGRNTGWNPGTKIAKVGGTAIPAMSGTTPGSGSVTFYYFDGTNLVAGDTIAVYSCWKDPIAAGTWVQVSLVDMNWFISAVDC